jgi:hypothetical protein
LFCTVSVTGVQDSIDRLLHLTLVQKEGSLQSLFSTCVLDEASLKQPSTWSVRKSTSNLGTDIVEAVFVHNKAHRV